jgi:hypothetical protein
MAPPSFHSRAYRSHPHPIPPLCLFTYIITVSLSAVHAFSVIINSPLSTASTPSQTSSQSTPSDSNTSIIVSDTICGVVFRVLSTTLGTLKEKRLTLQISWLLCNASHVDCNVRMAVVGSYMVSHPDTNLRQTVLATLHPPGSQSQLAGAFEPFGQAAHPPDISHRQHHCDYSTCYQRNGFHGWPNGVAGHTPAPEPPCRARSTSSSWSTHTPD